MKRRDFIQRAGITAAALAVPSAVFGKPKLYPWIEKNLQRRRSGQKPRFTYIHHCSQCDFDYLCPDRWEYNDCSPAKEVKRMGWVESRNHTCSPCLAQYDDANRAAWRETNRVNE
jgi:hypothetical protein